MGRDLDTGSRVCLASVGASPIDVCESDRPMPPAPVRRPISCRAAVVAVLIGVVRPPMQVARAREQPVPSLAPIVVDAIHVERSSAWWLVDDGVRKRSPSFALEEDAVDRLPDGAARAVLEAIESGEGGGFDDETGQGPPDAPAVGTACGIALVACVRDVATVFLRVADGPERAVRASRCVESDDLRSPTGSIASRRRRLGWAAGGSRAGTCLEQARRAAFVGDAAATLAILHRACTAPEPSADDEVSWALLKAQALERSGRFDEASLAWAEVCSARQGGPRVDSRTSSAVRAQLGRVTRRARSAATRVEGAVAPVELAPLARPGGWDGDGRTPLDRALDELAVLASGIDVRAGTEAVARRAGDARSDRPGRESPRASIRRRAVLAAAALALDVRDVGAARLLLRSVGRTHGDAEIDAVVDALEARLAATDGPSNPAPKRASR